MAVKLVTLLVKNFRTYTRLEMLIYLLLPLLMIHLVWMRCGPNHENPVHCFARRDGVLGDNVRLTPLYNSMERMSKESPLKELLVHTNDKSVSDNLIPALKNILKLKKIIQIKSEGNMEKHLRKGNYLAGIIWKVKGDNTVVTLRFPSTLRNKPNDLWNTDKSESGENMPTSVYRDEGFLQTLYAITAFLSQSDLSKPAQKYEDNGVTISSKPYILDNKYNSEINEKLLDPIESIRKNILSFYLGIFYIYPFIRLVMHMVKEKSKQQVDLMNISGSNRFLHYLSWFFSTCVLLTMINVLTIFLLTAPLCENGNVLNCSSFTALLFFFEVWAVSGICFCFLVYSLTQTVTLAAIVVAFFCILSFFLYVFLQPKQGRTL